MVAAHTDRSSAEVDVFRDTPVRLLGYANEVGESFRAIVHINVVRTSYMIAFGYCFADTAHKAMRASKETAHETESKNKNVVYTAIDALIWQSLASVVIPGFTINRVCHASLFLMKKYSNMPSAARKWSTVFVGIGCIPFIVKPIDSFVDLMLDNSLRLLISNELRDVK